MHSERYWLPNWIQLSRGLPTGKPLIVSEGIPRILQVAVTLRTRCTQVLLSGAPVTNDE